jgi:hypothetical protein
MDENKYKYKYKYKFIYCIFKNAANSSECTGTSDAHKIFVGKRERRCH